MKILQKKRLLHSEVLTFSFFLWLLWCGNAQAEIRTITANGEYRMGDNDTRTDAKRLALLDAKRLALEQAGTYIESITEVKNFTLNKEEIRAYTAGIVDVVEQATRDTMEGATHIVRVDVKVQVDTDIVTTQIDSLRKNEAAKAEIQRLRAETETLYRKLADLNATVGSSTPGTAAEVLQHRGQAMNRVEANALLSQAWSFLDLLKVTEESQHRAKSLTEKAVAIDPGNSQGHSTLGYIRYRYKDFVGARQEFQEAIQLDRNNLSAHDYLGHVLYDLGDFENAAFHYEEAIRIGGELSKHFVEWLLHSAYEKLGKQAQTQGNFDSAASYFTKMIRLHPESFGGYLWLGDALLEKGDTDAAIKEYRTAVLLNPNFAGTHLVLGQALKAKGNLAGSIVEFQMAVRLDPAFGKGHAQSQYGIALYESGRIEEAISELRTAIRLRPDEGNLHHFLDTVVTRCLPRVRYI